MADRHIVEQAKSRVTIESGRIVDLTEPLVKHCPLHNLKHKTKITHTKEFIQKHVENKIASVGMFTERRLVESDVDLVPFGASEMLMCAMKHGVIDCAVLACDGAGTVLATTPQLVQGIGGLMSGLISTTPLEAVIRRLEKAKAIVLDPEKAEIDQVSGVRKAFELRYRKVAVTFTGDNTDELPRVRETEKLCGGSLTVLAVHTTGVSPEQAEVMVKHADLVWGCASKFVRQTVGPNSILQIGTGIPVFAVTKRGKEIVAKRIVEINSPILIYRSILPRTGKKSCPTPLL